MNDFFSALEKGTVIPPCNDTASLLERCMYRSYQYYIAKLMSRAEIICNLKRLLYKLTLVSHLESNQNVPDPISLAQEATQLFFEVDIASLTPDQIFELAEAHAKKMLV